MRRGLYEVGDFLQDFMATWICLSIAFDAEVVVHLESPGGALRKGLQ